MSTQVTALYKDRVSAANALDKLAADGGIPADDISVLMSEDTRGREFEMQAATKAPEGAAAGAATGGVLGGIAASLVAVGVVAAPGIGLLAAGPILAGLVGAGAGAAAGGVVGGLAGLGFPEHEAKLVSKEISGGAILIGVQAHEDRVDAVKKSLTDTGGSNVR